MDPSDVAFIKAVIAFLLCAGTGLTALRMWLRARAKPLPPGEPDSIVQGLREDAERLEAELGQRIVELEERLDFVERRLVQERESPRLPEPEARTPV
ncbi:MAG TPA: hypothetical protein VMH88_09525 [Gemmatimonadales bacterium]|nr:hypothetical protein [Gemmatimonadales bacterium]